MRNAIHSEVAKRPGAVFFVTLYLRALSYAVAV